MTLFGYKTCTAKYARKEQEDTFVPIFGFSYWTFNNPKYKTTYEDHGKGLRRIRMPIGREKGFYIHFWLFSYRFDLDFHKTVLERIT